MGVDGSRTHTAFVCVCVCVRARARAFSCVQVQRGGWEPHTDTVFMCACVFSCVQVQRVEASDDDDELLGGGAAARVDCETLTRTARRFDQYI